MGLSGVLKTLVLGREDGLRARLRRRMGLDGWFENGSPPSDDTAPPAGDNREPVVVPTGYTAVVPTRELADGAIMEAIVDGVPVAVCNVGGEFHAVSNVCPHAGGPIGDGMMDGHTVVCPYHGWSFDVRDGRCFVNDEITLPTYDVQVSGSAVCVRVRS